ncbi:unnamed protein product [Amoebophrya sp. A120]|nr:unnamed protein product [Amoebophrya sp. A120]|eukprot:GSA120T00004807001.1
MSNDDLRFDLEDLDQAKVHIVDHQGVPFDTKPDAEYCPERWRILADPWAFVNVTSHGWKEVRCILCDKRADNDHLPSKGHRRNLEQASHDEAKEQYRRALQEGRIPFPQDGVNYRDKSTGAVVRSGAPNSIGPEDPAPYRSCAAAGDDSYASSSLRPLSPPPASTAGHGGSGTATGRSTTGSPPHQPDKDDYDAGASYYSNDRDWDGAESVYTTSEATDYSRSCATSTSSARGSSMYGSASEMAAVRNVTTSRMSSAAHAASNHRLPTINEEEPPSSPDLYKLQPIDRFCRPIPRRCWKYDGEEIKEGEATFLLELYNNPQYYELTANPGWVGLRCALCFSQFGRPSNITAEHTPVSNLHTRGLRGYQAETMALQAICPAKDAELRRKCSELPPPLRPEQITEGIHVPEGFSKWGEIPRQAGLSATMLEKYAESAPASEVSPSSAPSAVSSDADATAST